VSVHRALATLVSCACALACPRAMDDAGLDAADERVPAETTADTAADDKVVGVVDGANGAALAAALGAAMTASLPSRDDGAAVLDLATGRLLAVHHTDVVFARPISPGSVMKPFTAVALLEHDDADPAIACHGSHRDAHGAERGCWLHDGHGAIRLRTAIASSCNVYFYERAAALDDAHLLDVFRRFGLGEPLHPSLTGARRDEIPIAVAHSDVVDVAVGDDVSLLVTPISLLRAVTPFATRGSLVEPSRDGSGGQRRVSVRAADLARVDEGLRAAPREGTLQGVFADDDVAAKTGTAKRVSQRSTRGLVVGYAPVDAPEIAFVVVRDRGRGARDAGPAARAIVDTWRAHTALARGAP